MARVVITGIGVNSPIGCSLGEVFENISSGKSGLGHIRNTNTAHFPSTFGAEVKRDGEVVRTTPGVDRKSFFIANAVADLIAANDFLSRYDPAEIMMHMGSGIDHFELEEYVNSGEFDKDGWRKNCTRSTDILASLASQHHIKGGIVVNVSACVASTQAIGNSFRLLRNGARKAIITGGFDSMLSHLHYLGFHKLGALSSYTGDAGQACKPFDKHRCGLVIGEGGIALLLENEEFARKRGILAEIVGYSSTLDAYQITDPEPNGISLARAALNAIKDAGISPGDIDCVHLHETGTYKNALAESKAMERVFGGRFKEIPVYSMKGQIGHLIGACGAMEFTGVLYSLINQKVPATVNFQTPDPEVPLNVIAGEEIPLEIDYVLKLNSAFGGQNTAIVIRKYRDP